MNANKPQTEIERALTEAKANEIYSSQLMRKFRDTLSNVRDGLEDEGDRIYFGSTNDADQLRDIIEEVEELEWDRIMASSRKKPDLYARLRELNTEVRTLRSTQKDMLAALDRIFTYVSYVTVHGVGEQPEPNGLPQPMRVPLEEFGRIFQEIGNLARAAIAKAEGRS